MTKEHVYVMEGRVSKTSFNGKPYVILDVYGGTFLFTAHQFNNLKKRKIKNTVDTYEVYVPEKLRNLAYHKWIRFINEHPIFLKRVNKLWKTK